MVEDGRAADNGVDHAREIRNLISHLYRIGSKGEHENYRLSEEQVAAYIAEAARHIRPQYLPEFEMTVRAVRAGLVDWNMAAARLAAYFAPDGTTETLVNTLLDLAPFVGQVKSIAEAVSALDAARAAAAFGDMEAARYFLTQAGGALAGSIPGPAGAAARKAAAQVARAIENHHVFPRYLGGRKDWLTVPLTRADHQELHRLMQSFMKANYPMLAHSGLISGFIIRHTTKRDLRVRAIDDFYRTLNNPAFNQTRQSWLRMFPELQRWAKPAK
jgi:hypothetical protein